MIVDLIKKKKHIRRSRNGQWMILKANKMEIKQRTQQRAEIPAANGDDKG